jgi:DNA-directed RNA polymerase specialized sigma subunit
VWASDEELMASYQAGDRRAFNELFERYAPLLLRVVHTSCTGAKMHAIWSS